MPALAADYVRAGSETAKYLPPLHDGHKIKATIVTTSKVFALRLRPYMGFYAGTPDFSATPNGVRCNANDRLSDDH